MNDKGLVLVILGTIFLVVAVLVGVCLVCILLNKSLRLRLRRYRIFSIGAILRGCVFFLGIGMILSAIGFRLWLDMTDNVGLIVGIGLLCSAFISRTWIPRRWVKVVSEFVRDQA